MLIPLEEGISFSVANISSNVCVNPQRLQQIATGFSIESVVPKKVICRSNFQFLFFYVRNFPEI